MRRNFANTVPAARHVAIVGLALLLSGCSLIFPEPSASPSPTPTERPHTTNTPAPPSTPGPGVFKTAGAMNSSRTWGTATLLADGRVLFTGGKYNGKPQASAEIFDPATGKFASTGSMNEARYGHTATLLSDGRVLIAGGGIDRAAEIYNPKTGTFKLTGFMLDYYAGSVAAAISGTQVLVAGGALPGTFSSLTETYNLSTGRWRRGRPLLQARTNAVAVTLTDGRIFIVGGDQGLVGRHALILASAETYNPATGRINPAASMKYARSHFAAARLNDGRVLVVGGVNRNYPQGLLDTAEIYDPNTNTWTQTGSMMEGRSDFTATTLQDGRVLVAGGGDNSAELFDPATGTFQPAASMLIPRVSQTATLLQDGRVLIAGGDSGTEAEFWLP